MPYVLKSPVPLDERVKVDQFDEFAKWYAARHRRKTGRNPSPTTVLAKRSVLAAACNSAALYQATVGSPGGLDALHRILGDRAGMEKLIDGLLAQQEPGTVRQKVYALSDYADWLIARGELTVKAINHDDAPPMGTPPPVTIYTRAEMDLFVSSARGLGLRWWALIATLADTGRRIGEVLKLEWPWFTLDGNPAYVHLPTTKNGTQQYMPLTRRLAGQVFTPANVATLKADEDNRRYKQTFGRPASLYPFPWTYSSVNKRFHLFCDALDIDHRGFHNFRHTVITNRLADGMPPQAVQALAGHKSLQTTMNRYSHATALDYWRFVEAPELEPRSVGQASWPSVESPEPSTAAPEGRQVHA